MESIDQVSLIALRCAHPRHVLELAPQQMRALLDLRGPESYPGGPEWITRGAQLYGVSLYRAETGRRGYEAARGDMINSARRAAMPLRDGEANGGVAFLAVEWLAARAGDPSIFEYYRLLPSSETWKEAFATAFGITIEEFFAAFEEYRAELVLPVAHLADDRTGPVLVFLGDVPEDREAAIRADFERVGAFVSERFEAEPREFTLYVGPDKESLRDVVPSWPIYASTICSGFVKLDVAIISLTHPCSTSTRQDVYYIQAFLPGYGSTPEWMHVGAEGYVTAAYHAVAKGLDIAEHRASLIEWARRIPTPLQSLETSRGVAGISLALGYFAVEWLAERAGEPALFDFYEQLSPRDDWKQVFEATFGISLEDFYEEFEAHIAEITQQ